MTEFFDVRISVRLRLDELKDVNLLVNLNQDKFDNVSHFVRSAVIKLIREQKNKIRGEK